MAVYIRDLPQHIQELCFQRQREQGNSGNYTGELCNLSFEGNFNWGTTPEGSKFWEKVYAGIYPPAQSLIPMINESYSIF